MPRYHPATPPADCSAKNGTLHLLPFAQQARSFY